MKEFTRFFSQTFIFSGSGARGGQPAAMPASWEPLVDIYECDDRICVVAELPGVDKDGMSVTYERGVLRIEGFRPPVAPDAARSVHQMEIPHGRFARYVPLPRSVDVDNINANLKDGYLTVTIPRKAR